jgi:hypothetical protein
MAESQSKKSEALLIAEADSKDCDDCRGDGMVMVYASGYTGSPVGELEDGRRYVARTMAHCRCPMGRFLRASWPEDLRRRTPDLIDVLNGRSLWSENDPTAELVDDPGRTVTKEDFDAFWQTVEYPPPAKKPGDVAVPRQTPWSVVLDLRKRLCRELGLDERIANSLTMDQLRKIEEVRDSWVS